MTPEQISHGINYDEKVSRTGQYDSDFTYELFISHSTKGDIDMQNLVIEMARQLGEDHGIERFFDKDSDSMKVNVLSGMFKALNTSRILVPVFTQQYMDKLQKNRSWPIAELHPFLQWEVQDNKNRIIPVLVGISRDNFQEQRQSIPPLVGRHSIVIPPEYKSDPNILAEKVKEIVSSYRILLKQWSS